MPICGTSGRTVLIRRRSLRKEDGQPFREVEGVAQPLNTVHEDSDRAAIKDGLQCTADVYSEQEHYVHHQ